MITTLDLVPKTEDITNIVPKFENGVGTGTGSASTQSWTFNEPGVTFNEPGYLFNYVTLPEENAPDPGPMLGDVERISV